jgi:hypothetical protein
MAHNVSINAMNHDLMFSEICRRLKKSGVTYIEILENGLRWHEGGRMLELKIKEVVMPKNKNRINQ